MTAWNWMPSGWHFSWSVVDDLGRTNLVLVMIGPWRWLGGMRKWRTETPEWGSSEKR